MEGTRSRTQTRPRSHGPTTAPEIGSKTIAADWRRQVQYSYAAVQQNLPIARWQRRAYSLRWQRAVTALASKGVLPSGHYQVCTQP